VRTIFLDFDGPLHPTSAIEGLTPSRGVLLSEAGGSRGLFRWLCHLEEALVGHEDVAIVVHSAWASYATNDELRTVLGALAERFVGITPRDMDRWEGIRHVIDRFGIDSYRVIDDAVDKFPDGLQQLIAVSPLSGLSDPAARHQIRQWLSESAAPAPPDEGHPEGDRP